MGDPSRGPHGSPGAHDETHEGADGFSSRGPTGTAPSDAILLASGGALPASTVAKISTPIPGSAKRGRNGVYVLTAGGIAVKILPDTTTTAKKMTNRAKTSLRTKWTGATYNYTDGKITSFRAPEVSATIQTTYGPGASPTQASAYGKGKTLKDHEGHHGSDFLAYMRSNPPTFGGQIGMTVGEFNTAIDAFNAYMTAYDKKAGAISEKETDCTGVKASFCQ